MSNQSDKIDDTLAEVNDGISFYFLKLNFVCPQLLGFLWRRKCGWQELSKTGSFLNLEEGVSFNVTFHLSLSGLRRNFSNALDFWVCLVWQEAFS